MSKFIDYVINFFKWPVAIYMLVCLPALYGSFHFFDLKNVRTLALIAGCVFFIFVRTMMDKSVKTTMQVLAHELSHAFFAFITGHKVKHIKLNADDSGGETEFIGEGNWLITVAPYFFPLFALIYMILMCFLPEQIIWHGMLGFFLSYHIDSVAAQIHEKQTDFPKAGYVFCLMFLPAANLWTIGSILAFNAKGWGGVETYFKLINQLNMRYFLRFLQMFADSF